MSKDPAHRRGRGLVAVLALTLGALACAPALAATPAHAAAPWEPNHPVRLRVVDDRATPETRSLFQALRDQRGRGILFGHQHDLTHGATFTTPDGRASDTLAAVGDYPAVFGLDTLILEGKEGPGDPAGTPARNVAALRSAIEQGDARGGVVTLSAHMPNFLTGGGFYDTSGAVVPSVMPGGATNAEFTAFLDRVAAAVTGARRADGSLVPVIFRPFHENNGGWFWWGAGHATPSQYVELYRYTVEYLRDAKHVHNLLYAYSPNASFAGDPAGYLRTYPGDEFVDVLGYDAYDDSAGSSQWLDATVADLAMVATLAQERGKVPAYTEFGESGAEGRDTTWFTDLLGAIEADPEARQVAYMMTWADWGGSARAYVPYPATDGRPAHPLLADFVAFHDDPATVFAADLPPMFDHRTKAEPAAPLLHVVSPTDRERFTTPGAVVRARVTSLPGAKVSFSVDGGPATEMTRGADGLWAAPWIIDPSWLDNRQVTVTVRATAGRTALTDSVPVLLGAVAPLPAGWVDDFEGYAGDDTLLAETYSHVNANTTTLTTEHKRGGRYGLAYGYDFSGASYTGIGRSVSESWAAYSTLSLWLQGDGSGNGATIQVVADGVYFEYNVPLADTSGRDVVAPFADFRPAPWDTAHAGARLDADHLAKVTALNLYLGKGATGPTTGTVYVDDIRAD